MKTTILNGKRMAYYKSTRFEVQTGKGTSGYKTIATFTGDLKSAVFHFNCINVHSGYKKRLYSPDMNKPVIARVLT